MKKYDFSGWATRNNLRCSDGRTIMKDAFKDNDGQTVPLVWNHQHNDPLNVLGHALLENRDNGVYAYCTLNDTEAGRNAKLLVEHGDVSALSIYANHLRQSGGNVLHGAIREVSLVLAGANPGAFIDTVIQHGEESDDEAIIYSGEDISLCHSDEGEDPVNKQDKKPEDMTVQDVIDSMTEEQKNVMYALIGQAIEDAGGEEGNDNKNISHADNDNEEGNTMANDNEKTVQDVVDSMTEEQKNVMYALIGKALEDAGVDENDYQEGDNMKHNVFDNEEMEDDFLSHDAMDEIIGDAKRFGSMKESFLAHAGEYGIDNIEYLFPDARNVTNTPDFIKRDMGWVSKVMGSTKHTPFSRIKSVFADITEDEARAKGYIKGKLKKEEVFTLLKRTTTPTTIYKKQKMDRDDVIDITDFDVIAWLKGEMRLMLDEEIARAILVGDGRNAASDDKINEQNIRPIWTDEDLYTIKATLDGITAASSADERAKAFIRTVIKSRKDYKGSGNPTLFTTEDVLTDCLLLEDKMGRVIYDSVEKLATTLRVKEIVTVPVLENLKRKDTNAKEYNLMGLVVNLADYNVGADKGGAINMFDDFDIDYNQQKYLIETHCSGALIKPYSAIAVEYKTVADASKPDGQ